MKTRILSLAAILILNITALMAQTGKREKFEVSGSCEMSKVRIENAAESVDGVSFSEWNNKSDILEIAYDSTKANIRKVHMSIKKTGHDTKMYLASDEAYEKLPDCCKYERIIKDAGHGQKLSKIARIDALEIK